MTLVLRSPIRFLMIPENVPSVAGDITRPSQWQIRAEASSLLNVLKDKKDLYDVTLRGDMFNAEFKANVETPFDDNVLFTPTSVGLTRDFRDSAEVIEAFANHLASRPTFGIAVLRAIMNQHGLDALKEITRPDDFAPYSGVVRRVIEQWGGRAHLLKSRRVVEFSPVAESVENKGYHRALEHFTDEVNELSYEFVARHLNFEAVSEILQPYLFEELIPFIQDYANDDAVRLFMSHYGSYGQTLRLNESQDEIVKILELLPVDTGLATHELTALDLKYDDLVVRSVVEDTIYQSHLLPISENNMDEIEDMLDDIVRENFSSLEESNILPLKAYDVLKSVWNFDDTNLLTEIAQKDSLDDIELDKFDVDLDIENEKVKKIIVGLLAAYHAQDLIEKAVIDYQGKAHEVLELLLVESDGLEESLSTVLDRYGFNSKTVTFHVLDE